MAPKIKIENKTRWRTADLRRIAVRVIREEFDGSTKNRQPRPITVVVGLNRGRGSSYCSGWATYNSGAPHVNVPNPDHTSHFPSLDFAHVLAHELAHCRGLGHSEMAGYYHRGPRSNAHFAWASQLTVRPQKVPTKPSVDVRRAKKLVAAQARLQGWYRKAKLAETKIRIWKTRVRRLEAAVFAGLSPSGVSAAADKAATRPPDPVDKPQ